MSPAIGINVILLIFSLAAKIKFPERSEKQFIGLTI